MRSHVAALDGLRAIAVTAVIVFHARMYVPTHGAAHAIDDVLAAGWVGVDLFFVLSGFLITGILIDALDRPRFFRNFYVRRTLRIFPLYYMVLALVLFVAPRFLPTDDPGVQQILDRQGWLWSYLTNIEVFRNGAPLWHAGWIDLTHLWSLAVEEQFYLVWPLLVFFAPRRWLVAISAAIVVGAPILRCAMIAAGYHREVIYELTLTRLDPLAVGALLAVLVRARPAAAPMVARALGAAGALGVAVVIAIGHRFDLDSPIVQRAGFSALALGFGGAVLAATQPGAFARVLAARPLVALGRYSYAIYLFHATLIPVYRYVYDVDAAAAVLGSRMLAELGFAAFVLATSTVLATLSYYGFERYFLQLKERVAPRDTRPG